MTRGGVSASPAMWGARAAVLAVLAVVVIGVVVRSTQEGSRAIPAGLGPDGSPLAAGVPSDLSSASATVGFEVPLPSVNGFMDSDAKQVWVRSAWDPEVFITYANGSDLVIKQADYPGGAVAFYEELQKHPGLSLCGTPCPSLGVAGKQDFYFEKIRVLQAGLCSNILAWNNRIGREVLFCWFLGPSRIVAMSFCEPRSW